MWNLTDFIIALLFIRLYYKIYNIIIKRSHCALLYFSVIKMGDVSCIKLIHSVPKRRLTSTESSWLTNELTEPALKPAKSMRSSYCAHEIADRRTSSELCYKLVFLRFNNTMIFSIKNHIWYFAKILKNVPIN